MIEVDNKIYRNLQEQVGKNQSDIEALEKQLPYNGPYATTANIPSDVLVNGGIYLIGASAPYAIYKYNEDDEEYTNLGNFGGTGPTGATGPAGATGPQGPKGDKGDTGPAGATGARGRQGERGAQGPKGDQGPMGPGAKIHVNGVTYDPDQTGTITIPDYPTTITWDNIQGKPTIPSTTSQLYNDSGYITNAVDDLTNYYDKTYVDDLETSLDGDISDLDTELNNKIDTVNTDIRRELPAVIKESDKLVLEPSNSTDKYFINNTDFVSTANQYLMYKYEIEIPRPTNVSGGPNWCYYNKNNYDDGIWYYESKLKYTIYTFRKLETKTYELPDFIEAIHSNISSRTNLVIPTEENTVYADISGTTFYSEQDIQLIETWYAENEKYIKIFGRYLYRWKNGAVTQEPLTTIDVKNRTEVYINSNTRKPYYYKIFSNGHGSTLIYKDFNSNTWKVGYFKHHSDIGSLNKYIVDPEDVTITDSGSTITVTDGTLTLTSSAIARHDYDAPTGPYTVNTLKMTPSKTSELINDSGFITSSALPTKTSELTNDSNFVVSSSLATVATTGNYNDLTNKPTLSTVASTGDFDDLIDVPVLQMSDTSYANATYDLRGIQIGNETWNVLPPVPSNDGTYTLKLTITNGIRSYSWVLDN